MFFLLAIAATIGYSIQSVMMAGCYRTMDRLSTVAYRGLAIGIWMAPLLYFVSREDFLRFPHLLLPMLIGATLTAVANLLSARTYSFLPVGIATALSVCFAAIFTALLSFAVLDERLNDQQIFFMLLLVGGTLLLGKSKSAGALPAEYNPTAGIANSILFGIFISAGYFSVGSLSRQLHPFLIGYFWELLIGIIAANFAIARGYLSKSGLQHLSREQFQKVFFASSMTVIGTACFATATSMGPIGLASTIMASMMVFNSILGVFFFQEKLSGKQWLILLFICAALVGLKYAT